MKKIFFIITLFVLCNSLAAQKKITIDDIYQRYAFSQRNVYGLESLKDGVHYTKIDNNGKQITKYSYETGDNVETLFNVSDVKIDDFDAISEYQFSEDETKILVCCNVESIYRHSFVANYYIYDIMSKEVKKLSDGGKQQIASFSPDGTKVAFVRENNIFVKNLETMEETQLTTDGKFNEIINAAPDWVYEEEFSFSKAYDWSPDSKKIIFLKSDESNVKMFSMTKYGNLYTENYNYKYPKAGEENSKVSIHIINIDTKNIIKADLGDENDIYYPRMMFTKDANTAAVVKLNRLQNKYELFLVNVNNGSSQNIMTITDEKYIEIEDDDLIFLDDKKHFIFTNETSGYRHLYLYNINGNLEKQITSGNWEVKNVYGINEAEGQIYFQAAKSSPLNREIYTININSGEMKQLSTQIGTNNAEFSSNFKYYINKFTDANTPLYITLNNNNGMIIRELQTNELLKKKISQEGDYKFVKKEFFTFKTEDGTELNGWMLKPAKIKKKCPVLMYVYGGPGNQLVLNAWDGYMAWWQMLVQEGYIVVCVDNSGTGGRGKDFRQRTYKELGKYEVQDQISAVKYLGTLKYVDKERIGIFGWSYGGYMVSLCMTVGADYFKAGIAVAPVTNWRYYDSIYTERYNGLPQDNKNGYDNNSPIHYAKDLKGNLLIVHGTADDNVHFQNSVDFCSKLIDNNKQFRTMYYPNNEHSIYFGNSRRHLFTMMTDFIKENL